MSTNLRLTHLRFDVVARGTVRLGGADAGNRLRNALAGVMLRAVCPERERGRVPSDDHVAMCPACWLLAANVDAGHVRRAYSLVPPLPLREVVEAGERFSFVLTLYGDGLSFLPYFVLAVPEMGRVGVGPGRGQFELEAIWAADPLRRLFEPVLRPGETSVYLPDCAISWGNIEDRAKMWLANEQMGACRVRFLTPTRLISGRQLVKMPDFGVFFQRLLNRVDNLGQQFGGDARRDRDELARLHGLANGVRLMESRHRWVEVWSWSGRTRTKSPMGGFLGRVNYQTATGWDELLPWLLLGQATQVGKSAVKGNGVFELEPSGKGYWQWVFEF